MEIINTLSVWIHITCAALLVGGAFFLRFTVLKYGERSGGLTAELKTLLVNRYVHTGIGFLIIMLVTGLYNMTQNMAAWSASTSTPSPHMIFGLKFLGFLLFLGLVVFAGVSKGEKEKRRPMLLALTTLTGIVVIFLSVWLGRSY